MASSRVLACVFLQCHDASILCAAISTHPAESACEEEEDDPGHARASSAAIARGAVTLHGSAPSRATAMCSQAWYGWRKFAPGVAELGKTRQVLTCLLSRHEAKSANRAKCGDELGNAVDTNASTSRKVRLSNSLAAEHHQCMRACDGHRCGNCIAGAARTSAWRVRICVVLLHWVGSAEG